MTRDTREYGEKLIEAAGRGIMNDIRAEFGLTALGDNPPIFMDSARAALLAFLDKLLSEGPSEGMHAASFRELRCHVHDLDWAEDTFGKAFTAMLRTLRTEIAEER